MIARRLFGLLLCALPLLAHGQSQRGTFRISGEATNAITGEALAGARLELAPTEGAQWVKAALTLKDGRFAFEHLASGKYQLYAERAGYPRQGFDEHPGGFLSAIVTGSAVNSENLVFRLQPGATISGVVADEYGETVRDATVMLFLRAVRGGKLGTYFDGQTQSDDRGIYKFSPLMAGTYYVVVSAHPWYAANSMPMRSRVDAAVSQRAQEQSEARKVAFPLTFYSDATDASQASAINLRTGESYRADFNLHTVTAARIRIATENNPQAQSAVMLSQKIFDEFDLPVQGTMDMRSGQERLISGFAPGRYLLKVLTPGERGAERSQWMEVTNDTSLELESISGTGTASIAGLLYAEGVTLRNAFIQFRNRDTGELQGQRISNDGKFTVGQIPGGTYEVSVSNSASVYLASMAASNAKASGRMLVISPGAEVRMAIILSRGVGEINGTALHQGKGVSGVLVLLVPDNPQNHVALFRRDQSDSDGTFALHQVVPGHYTLLAIENGWDLEWTNPAVLRPFLGKGQPLVVEPSGKYDIKVAVQTLSTPAVARSD
jgi:hypothetical protein